MLPASFPRSSKRLAKVWDGRNGHRQPKYRTYPPRQLGSFIMLQPLWSGLNSTLRSMVNPLRNKSLIRFINWELANLKPSTISSLTLGLREAQRRDTQPLIGWIPLAWTTSAASLDSSSFASSHFP